MPGTAVRRYGRLWRLGQWRYDDDAIVGRIGFEAEPGVTELWSEERNDFVDTAVPTGVTSPFAIRPADFRVAFQLRPGSFGAGAWSRNTSPFRGKPGSNESIE